MKLPRSGGKTQVTAAACGNSAARNLREKNRTCCTPTVNVSDAAGGPAGLWFCQEEYRQEIDNHLLLAAPPWGEQEATACKECQIQCP